MQFRLLNVRVVNFHESPVCCFSDQQAQSARARYQPESVPFVGDLLSFPWVVRMIAAGDIAVYRKRRTKTRDDLFPCEVELVNTVTGRARICYRNKVGGLCWASVTLQKLERIGGGLA